MSRAAAATPRFRLDRRLGPPGLPQLSAAGWSGPEVARAAAVLTARTHSLSAAFFSRFVVPRYPTLSRRALRFGLRNAASPDGRSTVVPRIALTVVFVDRADAAINRPGLGTLAALAAVAYGADGLCIEAHVEPSKGIGDDPKQALTPDVLKKTIAQAKQLWELRRT